jgi:hypothetical protein
VIGAGRGDRRPGHRLRRTPRRLSHGRGVRPRPRARARAPPRAERGARARARLGG